MATTNKETPRNTTSSQVSKRKNPELQEFMEVVE